MRGRVNRWILTAYQCVYGKSFKQMCKEDLLFIVVFHYTSFSISQLNGFSSDF